MTQRTVIAAIALALLLAACGRVGPPVRSQPPAASAGAQADEDRESEKEKP